MKKTLLVAVLAVALVLAFAATASARPNPNIYIAWDSTSVNGAAGPHAGYVTASEKCNVCHAVHYAATSGFDSRPTASGGMVTTTSPDYSSTWIAGTEQTEMLLRSSVGNSCNYCHIDTAVGGVQLWGGSSSNYTSADPGGASSHGQSSSAACTQCHAVHGANTFKGANEAKILRQRSDRPIQMQVLTSNNPDVDIDPIFADTATALASGDKYLQQVAFCSQCHAEYSTKSEATITGYSYYLSSPATPYKGHPLVSNITSFSAAGDTTPLNQVAYVDSASCRKCHDAGGTDQTGVSLNSFPHYTRGFFRFMTSGDDITDLGSVVSTSLAGSAASTLTVAEDGNCLKCHRDGAGAGVGLNY